MTDTTINRPFITREQETRLYAFLRERCEGDALRYELIAKKIMRAADGDASEWDASIVTDWLNAMLENERLQVQAHAWTAAEREPIAPFQQIRSGVVGNPHYQAFLDTLEQSELDAIANNAPFFVWISRRVAEMPQAGLTLAVYLRQYADEHLSQRVKAMRGLD